MVTIRRAVATLGLLALCACGPRDNPAKADAEPTAPSVAGLDSAALTVVTDDLNGGLNGVPGQISSLLRQASQLNAFPIDQFVASGDNETIQLDGWMAERGLLTYVGQQYGRLYGALSPAGNALATSGDAIWFKAAPGAPEDVACHAGQTLNDATCTFVVTYTIAPTAFGKQALGAIAPYPVRIEAEVSRSALGWSVVSARGQAQAPQETIIDQLVGPADQRSDRRDAALAKWLQAAAMSAGQVGPEATGDSAEAETQ